MRVAVRIERADSMMLDDGTEALLSAVLPPSAGLAVGPDETSWAPVQETKHALEALILGKSVEIATAGRRTDRYGRLLVHAFVQRDGQRVWVQGDLIESGLARAYGLPGNLACLQDLLGREREARLNRRGHWATGAFQDRDANDPVAVVVYRDTFQTWQGRVDAVKQIRGLTIIAFGPGRGAFEAVLTSGGRQFKAGAPGDLAGRRIRVRGWVELRSRPTLRLPDASLIEVLDDAPTADTPPAALPSATNQAPIPASTGAR